ncbi:MAG: GldG family protein [Spirochaetales bacterium]|jgi:gliding-associated putative ABC transporter substrate-binding component GldG|nr:GldG family protein [Spirochaetales bacterium]
MRNTEKNTKPPAGGLRAREILLSALTLLVLVLAAANSLVYYTRVDLTENKAFSISDVSKNLFRDIPEQVLLTYYISKRLETLTPIPGQIEDLLYEYAAYGRGRIRVSVVDPEKAAAEGLRLEELGIAPQQVQVVEQNEQSVATVYTGIVISYLDSREVLPVVFNPSNLEYELTRRIQKLVSGKKPAAAFLFGKDGMTLSSDMNMLASRLSESYTVRELQRGEEIPSDISVLFVFGGRDFEESALYAIDQYIMSGGKALIAADAVDVDIMRNLAPSAYGSLPLFDMLKTYGAELGQDMVLDANAKRIPVQRNTGFMTVQSYELYNHWVAAAGQGFSRTHPVTAGLSGFTLFWPSSLSPRPVGGVSSETLISSGRESWILRERFPTNPYEAASFRVLAANSDGRYPLALALQGAFPSYFAGKPAPSGAEGSSPSAQAKRDISPETRLIVLGDADAGRDVLMRVGESDYNVTFFENAADWLSGEDSLMQIRARLMRDMSLSRIEEREPREAVILFSQIVNLVCIPLFIAGAGILRYLRRRERYEV